MMMLRFRPRAGTSKQAKMADHSSLTSQTQDCTLPISPFLCSPRFFRGFITKTDNETESLLSPTSILDTKHLFSLGNPIWYDNLIIPKSPKIFPGNKQYNWEKLESKNIGLAIINSPNDEKLIMFNSKLKIQIPPFSPIKSPESPVNPINNSLKSKLKRSISDLGSANSSIKSKDSPLFFSGYDHNPKPTNIFDSLNGDCGIGKSTPLKKKQETESFLSLCYTCKKKLGQKKDIYIYKGEKSFCSRACRCQEMMLDGMENSDFDF